MNAISILIPCYNEAPEVLKKTIEQINQNFQKDKMIDYEIIVINDGSSKFSYKTIQTNNCLKIINHEHNKGYGAALKTGIRNAQYQWIGITDADSTYPNENFSDFFKYTQQYDMIVGARSWKQISWLRKIPKYILTSFASYLAKFPIKDLNSGMRIFKRELSENYRKLYPNGFSFTSTITMVSITSGYALKYIPIEYAKRSGKSHIKPIKDTVRFFSLIFRLSLYFNPSRIFMPMALLILIVAIARGIRDYFLLNYLGGLSLVLFFMAFQVFFFGLLAEIISKTRN